MITSLDMRPRVGVAVGVSQDVSIIRDIGVESDHHPGGSPDLRGDSQN